MLVLGVILVACTEVEKEGPLTKADVQKVNEDRNYEDVITIIDQRKLDSVKKSLEGVKWDPHTKAEMARKEDVIATLFYSIDKNMHRLYEYSIWFESNETATIISNKENEGYGKLDRENAQNLKNILFN